MYLAVSIQILHGDNICLELLVTDKTYYDVIQTKSVHMSQWGVRTQATPIHFSHYSDVIMSTMASQITNFMIVYSTVYSGADQRKHQSAASLAFVRGIHPWPVIPRTKGQ